MCDYLKTSFLAKTNQFIPPFLTQTAWVTHQTTCNVIWQELLEVKFLIFFSRTWGFPENPNFLN